MEGKESECVGGWLGGWLPERIRERETDREMKREQAEERGREREREREYAFKKTLVLLQMYVYVHRDDAVVFLLH